MAVQIQLRNDTAANWIAADPILAQGEMGIETDTDKFKLGNGVDSWSELPYGGLQGPAGPTGADGATGPAGADGPQGPSGVISVSNGIANAGTSTSAVLSVDSSIPRLSADNSFLGVNTFTSSAAASVPVTITAAAGQSANLLLINANGTTTRINAFGELFMGGTRPFVMGSTQFASTGMSLNAPRADIIPVAVRGAASQTANLQEWQNSAGTNLANMTSGGFLWAQGFIANTGNSNSFGGNTISGVILAARTANAGNIPLAVRGAASQTANLTEWQDSAGTVLSRIASNGSLTAPFIGSFVSGSSYIQTGGDGNSIQVFSGAVGTKGLVVRGFASQTANLQEWQDSAGTVLARVDNLGQIITSTTVYANNLANNTDFWSIGNNGNGRFTARTASIVPMTLKGAASQTADLMQVQTSAGTTVTAIKSTGAIQQTSGAILDNRLFNLGINGSSVGVSWAYIAPAQASEKPLVIRGAASQTANLTEWQNSAGTVLARVTSGGIVIGDRMQTLNGYAFLSEANSGGQVTFTKQSAATSNPGANLARLYFRDGTNAGTLKLVVRAGASGAETPVLDNIDTTDGVLSGTIDGGTA